MGVTFAFNVTNIIPIHKNHNCCHNLFPLNSWHHCRFLCLDNSCLSNVESLVKKYFPPCFIFTLPHHSQVQYFPILALSTVFLLHILPGTTFCFLPFSQAPSLYDAIPFGLVKLVCRLACSPGTSRVARNNSFHA